MSPWCVLELRPFVSVEQRWYDGQLGKFDPTIAPQYYDRKHPWLAFSPLISQLSNFDLSVQAESAPLIRAWKVDDERPYRGHLREEFIKDLDEADHAVQSQIQTIGAHIYRERVELWNNCPVAPLCADFDELRKASLFEQAVDAGRQRQRGILEKQAWYRMAEAWILAAMQILPAKEEYLGIWMHSITEEDLKFFLSHARVPCFLIHELIAQEASSNLSMDDFVQGTFIAPLLNAQTKYNHAALQLNGGTFTIHDSLLPLPGVFFRPAHEHLLSGSHGQWGPLASVGRTRSESPGGVSIPGSDEDEEPLDNHPRLYPDINVPCCDRGVHCNTSTSWL
ncbi:hypothetical protein K438DRAFT_1999728 [Mycena galopus ATCC 62051]|nr:hypothetical protein K438DRAFT_1999728 [Mycena galopus ATCC 62051]